MLTVILPAAGEGSRLGLPYPKEVHRVLPGVSLIDFSLEHVREAADLVDTVATVIAPGKEIVAKYVAEALEEPRTSTAYFNQAYTEWPGSIRSAEDHFDEFNVALLPDSMLQPADGPLIRSFTTAFESGADLVFAAVPETDVDRLSRLGALDVDGGHVVGFCDKPAADEARLYNAFWGSFGFRREAASAVLDFMAESVARKPVDILSLGLQVSAFPVAGYADLGTWPAIAEFVAGHERAAA